MNEPMDWATRAQNGGYDPADYESDENLCVLCETREATLNESPVTGQVQYCAKCLKKEIKV